MEVTAYIDESYWSPSQGAPPHFYILAVVTMSREQEFQFREFLGRSGGLPFHTSEEARSLGGKLRLMQLLETISNLEVVVEVFYEHIPVTDRLGESTRARLLREAIRYLGFTGQSANSVTYDRRLPGYQANTDARTFASLRSAGLIHRNVSTLAKSATVIEGLVAADAVAWSYRQHRMGMTSMYWHLVKQK